VSRAATLVLVLASLVLVQGCAAIPVVAAVGAMTVAPGEDSRPAPVPSAAPVTAPADAPLTGTVLPRLGALPPQDLAPGACALFLFTRGADSHFAAFAPAGGETLLLAPDGAPQTFAADAPPVERAGTFAQTYRNGAGLTARLTAAFAEAVPQGRRVSEASLRLSLPDGTARVIPLTGLAACAAEG
jgi:hypothetical protein